METIRELREKLQGDKLRLRKETWGYRYLRRGISIYVTRLLIRTKVRPNQITVVALLAGATGAALVCAGWFWAGLTLVYVNIMLDAVDGEVARYKKVFSLRGIYLDRINHFVIQALFFLAVTFDAGGVFNAPNPFIIVLGTLGALTLPVRLASGYLHYQLYVRPYMKTPEVFPAVSDSKVSLTPPVLHPARAHNPMRLLKNTAYQLNQFVITIIAFGIGHGVESYLGMSGHPIVSWLIIGYASLYLLYFLREIIAGYFSVEKRIASLASEI